MDDQEPVQSITWDGLRRKVHEAHCTLHRSPGAHIVVVEDIWVGRKDIGERKPFLRAFPDNEDGYIAALSAILRRYPHLNDTTIVCAVCGQAKSLDQFDSRFFGKPTKKVCATCRSLPAPEPKRMRLVNASLDQAKLKYQERYPQHHWQFATCMSIKQVEDLAHQIEAKQTRLEAWQAYCHSLRFDKDDIRGVNYVHRALRESQRRWCDAKTALLALNPPYLGRLKRHTPRLSLEQRKVLYEGQQGKCAYCKRDLLPLNYRELPQLLVHWRDIPHFQGSVPQGGMVVLDRDRIPELEHRLPVTRGGTDDLENLCFACRKCNQSKDVRTVQEFADMPNDPVTQLAVAPWIVVNGLLLEQRGYERFDDLEAEQASQSSLFGFH